MQTGNLPVLRRAIDLVWLRGTGCLTYYTSYTIMYMGHRPSNPFTQDHRRLVVKTKKTPNQGKIQNSAHEEYRSKTVTIYDYKMIEDQLEAVITNPTYADVEALLAMKSPMYFDWSDDEPDTLPMLVDMGTLTLLIAVHDDLADSPRFISARFKECVQDSRKMFVRLVEYCILYSHLGILG